MIRSPSTISARRAQDPSQSSIETSDRMNAGKPGFDVRGWALDPRTMAREQLEALGHRPMSALQAIRARCLNCSAGSMQEVRLCAATACPSWPFRMAKSPWRAPASEAQRAHLRKAAAKAAEGQKYGPAGATARVAAPVPGLPPAGCVNQQTVLSSGRDGRADTPGRP